VVGQGRDELIGERVERRKHRGHAAAAAGPLIALLTRKGHGEVE